MKIQNWSFNEDNAEKEASLFQPWRMLISGFKLNNGTTNTRLLSFYLELGLVCTKSNWFLQYTPVKCFKDFVKSGVNGRRRGDGKQWCSVVAETLIMLAKKSYGYQIMDRSWHSVTKYLNDESTHAATTIKLFERLAHIKDQLFEIELVKFEFEQKEPVFVGTFNLQYDNLRNYELVFNFFCKVLRYNQIRWGVSGYRLPLFYLLQKGLYRCIREEERHEWEFLRRKDFDDTFTADVCRIFLPRTCWAKQKNLLQRRRCTVQGRIALHWIVVLVW